MRRGPYEMNENAGLALLCLWLSVLRVNGYGRRAHNITASEKPPEAAVYGDVAPPLGRTGIARKHGRAADGETLKVCALVPNWIPRGSPGRGGGCVCVYARPVCDDGKNAFGKSDSAAAANEKGDRKRDWCGVPRWCAAPTKTTWHTRRSFIDSPVDYCCCGYTTAVYDGGRPPV